MVGLTLPGCESDPLLAPQSEVSEEGGSYGNTNLPASGANDAKNDANLVQNGKSLFEKSESIFERGYFGVNALKTR